jgi:hypothetical protein
MTAKGSRKTHSSLGEDAELRNARIRAAGVVQAVISSGAPVNEWMTRSQYGLRAVNYWAQRLLGGRPDLPKVPAKLKGK